MQSKRQRSIFYFIALLSAILLSSAARILGEQLNISYDNYASVALPVGMFLIAWIYPYKIFSESGALIGMHRHALKAAGFFIFTSIGIYLDELLSDDLTIWTEILMSVGVLLLAILIYNLMLRLISKKIQLTNTKLSVGTIPAK